MRSQSSGDLGRLKSHPSARCFSRFFLGVPQSGARRYAATTKTQAWNSSKLFYVTTAGQRFKAVDLDCLPGATLPLADRLQSDQRIQYDSMGPTGHWNWSTKDHLNSKLIWDSSVLDSSRGQAAWLQMATKCFLKIIDSFRPLIYRLRDLKAYQYNDPWFNVWNLWLVVGFWHGARTFAPAASLAAEQQQEPKLPIDQYSYLYLY